MISYVVIDTETRNEGFDIKRDNKEMISCQLGDDKTQQILYKHGTGEYNLSNAVKVINDMINNGIVFVGFNLDFDLGILKDFQGFEIPKENLMDITKMKEFDSVRSSVGRSFPTLEQSCKFLNINVSHKNEMRMVANDLKLNNPVWKKEAEEFINTNRMVCDNYNITRLIEKKAVGTAISRSYDEFVKTGDKNSIFYRYAKSDVVSEFQLFKTLTETGVSK